jgi:glycosyltransferase involved in cell wall biosynthesis
MSNIDISVIIPSYQPMDYLFECLNSLKRQSYQKEFFEILIILNGEKEPFYSRINMYIKSEFQGYNIKLYYTDKKGVSNARNMGIDQSNGRYIAFIDDDDLISENYLLRIYDIAKTNVMPLSYLKEFNNAISDNIASRITDSYERNMNKKLSVLKARSFFSIVFCKLIDKNIISNRRFDIRFQNGEDTLFMFCISDKIKNIQLTNKDAIYYYRRSRNDSLSKKKRDFKKNFTNCFLLIFSYMHYYLKNPLSYNFIFTISRILACFRLIWS